MSTIESYEKANDCKIVEIISHPGVNIMNIKEECISDANTVDTWPDHTLGNEEHLGLEQSKQGIEPFLDLFEQPLKEELIKNKEAYLQCVSILNEGLNENSIEDCKPDRRIDGVKDYLIAGTAGLLVHSQLLDTVKDWVVQPNNLDAGNKAQILAWLSNSLSDCKLLLTNAIVVTDVIESIIQQTQTPYDVGNTSSNMNYTTSIISNISTDRNGYQDIEVKDEAWVKSPPVSSQINANAKHSISHKKYVPKVLLKLSTLYERRFVCPNCGKKCATASKLRVHKRTHVRKKPHSCNDCGKGYQSFKMLKIHMKQLHEPTKPTQVVASTTAKERNKHACLACNKTFSDESQLRGHLVSHQQKESIETHACSLSIKDLVVHTPSILERHLSFHCVKCGAGFDQMENLCKHFKNHEPKMPDAASKDSKMFEAEEKQEDGLDNGVETPSLMSYECPICDKEFMTKTELAIHISNIHAKEFSFICLICGAGFHQNEDLTKHVENHRTELHSSMSSCSKPAVNNTELKTDCDIQKESKLELPSEVEIASKVSDKCLVDDKPFMREHQVSQQQKESTETYKCPLCDKDSMTSTALAVHIATIHGRDFTFLCLRCGAGFYQLEDLSEHLQIHDQETQDVSSGDSKTFKDEQKPKNRLDNGLEIPSSMSYECPICDKEFMTKTELAIHISNFHARGFSYICLICGAGFNINEDLTKHVENHRTKIRSLSICSKSTADDTELKTKFYIQKGRKLDLPSEVEIASKLSHKCPVCDRGFKLKHGLKAHMLTHTGDKPHICYICGVHFRQISTLKNHILTHAREHAHHCSVCDKGFRTPSQLRNHMRTHTVDGLFKCWVCGMRLLDRKSQQAHMAKHNVTMIDKSQFIVKPKKQYHCSECDKYFSCNSELKVHILKHSGHRPFDCKECGAAFYRKSSLHLHKVSHTTERPYLCNECGKTFKHNHRLVIHMRKHTGYKPHQCKQCTKAFIQSTHLRIHMRTHTGERPFLCSFCGKGFTTAGNMRSHMKVHTKEKA